VDLRAMATSNSISGLMKWLRRDPWSEAFSNVLEHHLSPACTKAGIEMGELTDVVGDQWAATLWGCAFEDFLTRDLDGFGNVVEDYLKRRGWNEKAPNKAYMTGLRSSVMSLYEVSDVRPGESFLARDLFRGGEAVRISEHTATRTLKQWDRIAARVVEMRGKTVIGGGLLPFGHDLADTLLASLRRTRKRAADEGEEVLRGLLPAIGSADLDKAFDHTEVLRLAAPLISTVWLNDLLEKTLNPQPLEIRNSDDDEIVFLSLHYRLLPGMPADRVREALHNVPELRAESATFWNWLDPNAQPSGRSQSGSRSGLNFMSWTEDGSAVLGSLELEGTTLVLSVNSERRAERGRVMLAPVLEGMAQEPLVERQVLAQAAADRPTVGKAAASTGLPPEEERRITHESLDRHYRNQLDEPIPALGDVTPRQATKSAQGREKLVAWLKRLENHMAQHEPPGPMADYDVAWLWEELGIAVASQTGSPVDPCMGACELLEEPLQKLARIGNDRRLLFLLHLLAGCRSGGRTFLGLRLRLLAAAQELLYRTSKGPTEPARFTT
jgi:hypothetical protein